MMKKSRIIRCSLSILAATSIVTVCTAASDFIVRGVVTAASDNTPCPGVLYRVYADNDTVLPVLSNVADSLGRFVQPIDSAGHYTLRTEFIGTAPVEKEFTVSVDKPVADLDTLRLRDSSAMLEELVVTSAKPLIESDGATLTYNMTEDPMAQGNSVMEMLRKVPMVTVDAEENIKVKGQSNFKIYLNGKEDPMLSGDPKTILKSMPASTIKKIEVITEPGAKYDAEGTGGILNIVTIAKQNLEGVMTNLSAWVNRSSVGGSGYVRTKVGNVTGSVNVSYNHSIDNSEYTSFTWLENLTSETDHRRETEGRGHNRYSYTGGGFNLSWEPDTLNLFTLEANIGYNRSKSYTSQIMRMLDAEGGLRWNFDRDYTSLWSGIWSSAQASYQHTFGKQGHHIVVSYQYSFNTGENSSVIESHDFFNYEEMFPWRRNQNDNHSNRHTLQIDYANPLSDKHLIEAGAKGNLNRSDAMSAPWYGTTPDNMAIDEAGHVSMAQYQNIYALYASYTGSFSKWSTRVGLRYEHTNMGIDYFTSGYESFGTNLNDWVPNASLTYKLTGMQNFRLAYQMRISRPGIYSVNPYRNTMTVGEVSYGNPDLKSQKSHWFSLSYNNYGGNVGGSASLGYSHVGNQITNYSFMQDNIMHNTYANIGSYDSWNLSGNMQWTIIQDMSISLSGYLEWENYKADTPMLRRKRHGWYWNYNVNWDYRLPCKLRISAYGGQGSRWITLDSEGQGWYYYGLSLARSFLKDDALTVNLFGQSFLPTHRVNRYTSSGEGLQQGSWYRSPQWYAGMSVSWRFGKLNSDVKRTGARIEAESETSGQSTGGGGGR